MDTSKLLFKNFCRNLVFLLWRLNHQSCCILSSSCKYIPNVIWEKLKKTSFLENLCFTPPTFSELLLGLEPSFLFTSVLSLSYFLILLPVLSDALFFSCYDCWLFRLKCHKSLTSRPVSTKCWMMCFSHSCALITATHLWASCWTHRQLWRVATECQALFWIRAAPQCSLGVPLEEESH